MANETLILGNNNWAVKTSNLLGYAIGETSGEYVPREFTFSRASTATYTNKNGVIQTSASNIARVQDNALLLEPQRTNLFLWSEGFDNNYWVKSLGTLTTNVINAPNGTLTADLFTKTSAINTVSQVASSGSPYLQVGIHTLSVYVKQNIGNLLLLRLDNTGNSANFQWNFSTKTFSNIGANAISSSFQELSNGWFRLIVTGNVTSTAWTISVANMFQNPTNDSVYIWGAQLEQGAYATTYIPTTSATVTRLADTFTRNNIYTNGYISPLGGTWYVELKNNVSVTNTSTDRGIFISDINTGIGNTLGIRRLNAGRCQITKVISGSTTLLYTTLTDTVKIAIKWNGTSADVFVNGVKVVSATSFTTTVMENLGIRSGEEPYLFIQAMSLYNTPLTDEELILKTTL